MKALIRSTIATAKTKLPRHAARVNQRASSPKQRKQQHLLDVKVRSRKAVEHRTRRVVTWISVLILIAGTAGAGWFGGREAMRRFFWENAEYNIANIEVKTDGPLTRDQILDAAGVREGRNIFSVDIAQSRKNLLAVAQVEHAEVGRVLPNKITIDIAERKPVAWVASKLEEDPTAYMKGFLIDRKGVLMRTKSMTVESFRLPVICGVTVGNFEAGDTADRLEIRAALELLRLTAENPARFQVRSIDVSKGYCMVVTDERRARITFKLDEIDAQLDRLAKYLEQIDASKRDLQTVNLMVVRNTPVTYRPPPEPEPTPDDLAPIQPPPKPAPKPAPAVKPAVKKTTPVASHSSKSPTVKRAVAVRKKSPSKPPYHAITVRRAVAVHPLDAERYH